MINNKLLEQLAEIIPSSQLLVDSGCHKRLIIANRQNQCSIHARFHQSVFREFCQHNSIAIGDVLSDLIDVHPHLLVDIDSLLTEVYRIYFYKENFVSLTQYQIYNQYPIEEMSMDYCLNLVHTQIEYYKKTNPTEFYKRAAEANTDYAITMSRDDFGLHSVIDGVHRIYKLSQQGQKTVSVRVMPIRNTLDLIDNVVPQTQLELIDIRSQRTFDKLKSQLQQQEQELFNLKSFMSLGLYYNCARDRAELYKYYFQTGQATSVQYKIKPNGEYIGKYNEIMADDHRYFVDPLNLQQLFTSRIKSSVKRNDIDQSYLIVDIGE